LRNTVTQIKRYCTGAIGNESDKKKSGVFFAWCFGARGTYELNSRVDFVLNVRKAFHKR
jgi:hypothetical protein